MARSAEYVYSDQKCICQKSQSDKFENPLAFNFGPFKGQCIDSCRFRPAQILERKQYGSVKIKNNLKTFFVAQVLHNEEYRVARINPDDFSAVEAGFEEFTPGVFHTFLRFKIRDNAPAIPLLSQKNERAVPLSTRGIVISSEGVPPSDRPYRLLEGALNHYLLVHRVVTPEESDRWIRFQKNSVTFWKIEVDQTVVPLILEKALRVSHHEQFNSRYDLFSSNCATSMLHLLENSLTPKAASNWPAWIKGISIVGPFGTLGYMISQGLIVEPRTNNH